MEELSENYLEISKWEGDKTILKNFYTKCGYNYETQPDEEIIVTKIGEDIIGVVRLCHENGVLVIRGMQVKEELRGKGIGSKILEKLDTFIGDRECYCLPYAHLDKFYGQIGFNVIEESEAPDFLLERLQEYRNKNNGKSYLLMKRASI